MPGFELDLPKSSMPSVSSVPKIPLGAVGEPGMERFGQSLQSTANITAQAENRWNEIQKDTLKQNAYTESMKAILDIEESDYTKLDESEAEARSDASKLPTFAKDHYGWLKQEIERRGQLIPKDAYAQHHWQQATKQYLHQRMGELRMQQTNMLVADFETTTKRMLGTHESKLAAAQSVDELFSISDAQALQQFDQSQEAAIKNRITTRSKYEDNRLAALANFQRVRFNRFLDLNPAAAGAQFREGGQIRSEDLLRLVPNPDEQNIATLPAGEQEKLRGAYKERVATVLKGFIYGGHANQKTVGAVNDMLHFDSKQLEDLYNTATQQASNVHQAEERRFQNEKRAHEEVYNKTTTGLWSKLFDRSLTITDLEAAEKGQIFAQHPETLHSLHQAMKSLHQEDQGVNADRSLPQFLETKLKIQADSSSPEVQPEKWINSKMSLGQKSELYTLLREWQDKLSKNPKLHTDEYKSAEEHLDTITGSRTASYDDKGEQIRLMALKGQVMHTFALDVAGGMEVTKAFKKGKDFIETHNKALTKPILKSIPPGYVPPTNQQIEQQYPNPQDPRRYDAIEERKRYEDLLQQAEIEKQNKESQDAAAAELANRPSFWNYYNLFK